MKVSAPTSQTTVAILLLLVAVGACVLFFPRLPFQSLLLACGAVIVFIVAFLKIDVALVILIFSMLLSPELSTGAVRGREVTVRIEDILLIIVSLGWLARMAVFKEVGFLKRTPLNQPIMVYMFVYVVATLFGLMRNFISLKAAVFYLLKYFEYFLLFFMVANNIKGIAQIKRYVMLMLTVALIISIYAWGLHAQGVERVTAPFEGEGGEANTLGGYLLLMSMVSAALLLHVSELRTRLLCAGVIVLSVGALLFTLSRSSWLASIASVIALTAFVRKGRVLLIVACLSTTLFASVIFPAFVKERAKSTFAQEREYRVFGHRVSLAESAAARVESWRVGFERLAKEPIIGFGAGSAGAVVDNQYTRVLIEAGLLGFAVFVWVLATIYRIALFVSSELRDDPFIMALSIGFTAGFIGLIIHSFTAATFIIIRIMEPFWFLAALVAIVPQLRQKPAAESCVP